MRQLFNLVIVAALLALAGCSSSSKSTSEPSTAVPISTTTTTVDPAPMLAWYSHFQVDLNALAGTTNALKTDGDAALVTDCTLGRSQVGTLRSDLDDPVLRRYRKARGSLRGIVLSGLDQLDAGFVLCTASDNAAASGHLNAGIRLLNQAIAVTNKVVGS